MHIKKILQPIYSLKKKSLAERTNDKLISGYKPSQIAKEVVGEVSSKKFNTLMKKAVEKYNKEHKEKIFC